MVDFTNTRYLGMLHASQALPSWEQITTGVPAALKEPTEVSTVSDQLANLQRCQTTILGRSTLHILFDLFHMLASPKTVIYLDEACYPVVLWGVERAACLGTRVKFFTCQNTARLSELISRSQSLRPLIVCDGVDVYSGQPSPLPTYLAMLPPNGCLVVDDTQSLGLLGEDPDIHNPYGKGGGGSARYHAISDDRLVLVCSLAKSFGAPLAALSGSKEITRKFLRKSGTRVHCSPPSLPDILAARNALVLNAWQGDVLRRRLAGLVRRFRSLLTQSGLRLVNTMLPIQTLILDKIPTALVYKRLTQCGIKTVLRQGPRGNPHCQITFVITTRHTCSEIDWAARKLIQIVHSLPPAAYGKYIEVNGCS